MDLALDEILSRTATLTPEQLASIDPEELREIDAFLRRATNDSLEAKCSERVASFDAGPLYWLTNLTQTENPQYEAQGLPFKASFPKKSYFVPLFGAFLARYPTLFIPKSRTMMTSWAAMGFASWTSQWLREETVVQTMSEDKSAHLIDYVRQLWENQEPWLKERHPLSRLSTFAIAWQGGGEVASIPSGADKIRAFHPTTYIMDEAGYLPEGEDCLGAVRPTGARIIAISTARAGWFGDQCSL